MSKSKRPAAGKAARRSSTATSKTARPATPLDWQRALIAALSRCDMAEGKRITRLAAVADACVAAAMAGNVQAIREIAARLEAQEEEAKPSAVRIIHTFKSAL